MPLRGSHSGPDFRGSQSSIRRRRSITEVYPRPSVFGGQDLLLDPLYATQTLQVGNHPESPIHNVRQVLEAHPECNPLLYTEMLEFDASDDDDDLQWKQVSRWIKYEQSVEGDGTRFSKPHITLLTVLGLLQLKNCLRKGVIILDAELSTFKEISEMLCAAWVERGHISEENSLVIKEILNATKLHLIGKRLRPAGEQKRGEKISVIRSDASMNDTSANTEETIAEYERRQMKMIAAGTNAAVVLIGHVNTLDKPASALVRLDKPKVLYPEVPNIPLPVHFVFVLLNPHDHYSNETISIGRTMGALFSDEIFRKVATYSMEPFTIADALEEFFAQVIVIPPGNCSTETRWEPHETSEQEARSVGMLYACYDDPFDEGPVEEEKVTHSDIVRTGRLFGGLCEDIRRKAPFFISDFTDFFRGRLSQSLAAAVFLFFANVTSIITFGAVMERALHHQVAAIENILCGGISGVIFALLSGQPLNILSATGPTLIFETILFDFCITNGWEFLPFRFWVGMWISVVLVILVATDMSALVGLITRFTEEAFATLISVVFIIQSFEKLVEISHDAPIITDPRVVFESPCICHLNEVMADSNVTIRMKLTDIGAEECTRRGGEAIGLQCHFKPDVYMLSILLTFGTFALTYGLTIFRRTAYFGSAIRNSISDFAVFIAIVVMTSISHFVGLDVPVLNIPASFRPTLDRDWLIDPFKIEHWYVIVLAILPAIFYTILIVMDQQITAVIINRKDNKLRKGFGYHLDLLAIAALVAICSALGLPFYVAATVLSVMHVDSLRLQSETSAPGEKAQFLGVREQRLTAIIAHTLIGLSVFLTPVIKLVPLPVLIGVFLYMGVVSMLGLQFVQRISMLFMPIKHQPDYTWLRMVRMKRVHLFTFLQILSIVGLFIVKYTKFISMMFPLMLVFMVILRMFALEKIFTKQELTALDDIVPSFRSVVSAGKRSKGGETREEELETLNKLEDGRKKNLNGNH
uniref:Anion exchange protein n=1 Tax=Parascaris univalens TaxID=6257 RepID=A0A915B149_PARUN